MCAIGNSFILCSCLNEAKSIKTARVKLKEDSKINPGDHLTWTLYRYVKHQDSGMVGSLIMPSESISNELTNDNVLSEINSRNCFDFEYNPAEGDNLQIERNKNARDGGYLSFIFKNGKWSADSYYTFTEVIEPFDLGRIELGNSEDDLLSTD